jgi:excisionase family DNA binding protein
MRAIEGTSPLLVEEGLLRVRDAARLLAVSERYLQALTKSGIVPSVRLGKRGVRYVKQDIMAVISSHRRVAEVKS